MMKFNNSPCRGMNFRLFLNHLNKLLFILCFFYNLSMLQEYTRKVKKMLINLKISSCWRRVSQKIDTWSSPRFLFIVDTYISHILYLIMINLLFNYNKLYFIIYLFIKPTIATFIVLPNEKKNNLKIYRNIYWD